MKVFIVITAIIYTAVATPHSRVVGGEDAEYREFPHQVSLQWHYTDGDKPNMHFCGGSILNENWVLTAAHCKVSYPDPGYIEVAAGEHDLSQPDKSVQMRRAVEFLVHENYGGSVGPYDIGLVKVNRPFVFGEGVKPVHLPKPGNVPVGEAQISGWGSVSNGWYPEYPNVLQKAMLPIAALNSCQDSWNNGLVHESNVCAGSTDGTSTVCSGDSGGPLTQTDNQGNVVQIGIVSWGQVPCTALYKPAVFTRVSYYNDWINQFVEN